MTQEDKNLLLKDLCTRLPYEVMVSVSGGDFDKICHPYLLTAVSKFGGDSFVKVYHCIYTHFGSPKIENVKPYLRPMSSMTEEEKEEMHNLLSPEGTAIYENDGIALPINHCGEFVPYEFMNCIIQYLLKNHFDFMGLIPKGLALEASEGMYKEEWFMTQLLQREMK